MILIDPPNAAGHGRLWSHLASDTAYDELHAFARVIGVPERGFDRDHYDVPAEWYDRVVEAGATPVSSRELIARLRRAGLRRRKTEMLGPRAPGRSLIRPEGLAPGDLVAITGPSGPVDPDRLAAGIERLESWGLKVAAPSAALAPALPWLADSDEGRAAAFAAAWTDPEVRAVIATRGGYGAQRIVDLLDWTALAAAGPKLLVGFSDITALHQAFGTRLGLVTVHGPSAASLSDRDEQTLDALRALLFDGECAPFTGLTTGSPGRAHGPLTGGNVTVLAASAGTPHAGRGAGAIAVLEDVGEQPYRLDRSLTQLLRSGWFDDVRGIVCGQFTDCGDAGEVRTMLDARLGDLGVPVAFDAPIGHGPTNRALPFGSRATLDAGAGTLTVDEDALR